MATSSGWFWSGDNVSFNIFGSAGIGGGGYTFNMPLSGLNDAEVTLSQKKYGLNEFHKKKRSSLLVKALKKLSNPLILILLFSSILSALLGQTTDFYIILIILLVSVILDVYQENQAQNAADKLVEKIVTKAVVIRNGRNVEIDNEQIVVGDLIVLGVGKIIPADCKVVESENFSVDQSVLTGESFPVEKKVGDIAFMGTHVVSGFATVETVSIGVNTEIGKVARDISGAKPKTDFEIGLDSFSMLLVRLTVIFGVILMVVNLYLGHSFISSMMFVLALAIGFAPELLPMILTINLTKGALKLSKKGVIVKYLPAIENFGSMDILCTDKTGTLTVGNTVLKSSIGLSGEEDARVVGAAFINSYFQSGFSNPIDEAVLETGNVSVGKYKKIDELTYDFFRKRSSIVVSKGKDYELFCKGSVSTMLPYCVNKEKVLVDIEKLNHQGFRVIAVATKKVKAKKKYTVEDEKGMRCLGFLIFYDEPKLGASKVVMELRDHGVALKILTGDNQHVTESICQQIGLEVERVLTGEQIKKMSDGELREKVNKTTIFAGLDPDLKLRVILALKSKQHVVGFLGDGINDAPSLKNADVGISVNNAVDVAKESADLILLHKDLGVLLLGIREGRSTFANIMKYISMGTSSTFGNMVSLSVASIMLPFLPMLPVQILLNDLLYDVSQMLLVRDRVDEKLVQNPYKWNLKYIQKFTMTFGVISSVFDLITFYLLYFILKASAPAFQTGWFLESIITQMLIIFSIRTYMVPFYKSKMSVMLATGVLAIVALVLWLPTSFLGTYLHLVALPPEFFLFLILIVLCYFLLIEIVKYYFHRSWTKRELSI